ncbi:MAG: L-serine ammonia-lyase, iron-sulfur-dependent, subunit alpha, partial [Oscillospiraceae bacterium]|nr:L-serine ammonia-lyase, iron-sulfur-dependent, subunit alpha [Oscillospiraceae bacterium]
EETDSVRIFSIGGGSIKVENETSQDEFDVYPHSSFGDMLRECAEDGLTLMQLIDRYETPGVRDYLRGIWYAMEACVERGLKHEGILPGGLNVSRKAKILFTKRCYNESSDVTMNRLIASYAYAASEENASEEIVVTAPTCGSCGVIPSVFYYMAHDRGFPENEIIEALAVAGLIGNVIRTNASISGAECGCQAEIGSACSMAAGGLAYLYGLDNSQIEYAAEVAMEHHLGLTCDPVHGLVQIPCIERNAVAAMRAISAVNISRFLAETRKISFDDIIATMYQTGKDMDERYKETSHGGLAALYASKNTD